jgi:hypothetical protein
MRRLVAGTLATISPSWGEEGVAGSFYDVGVATGAAVPATVLKTSGHGSGLVKPAWFGMTTRGSVWASMTASAGTMPLRLEEIGAQGINLIRHERLRVIGGHGAADVVE